MGPIWDEVNRMLAAVEGARPVYGRDRALLMMTAVDGLRAGEAVGLRLEDFDWVKGPSNGDVNAARLLRGG